MQTKRHVNTSISNIYVIILQNLKTTAYYFINVKAWIYKSFWIPCNCITSLKIFKTKYTYGKLVALLCFTSSLFYKTEAQNAIFLKTKNPDTIVSGFLISVGDKGFEPLTPWV